MKKPSKKMRLNVNDAALQPQPDDEAPFPDEVVLSLCVYHIRWALQNFITVKSRVDLVIVVVIIIMFS